MLYENNEGTERHASAVREAQAVLKPLIDQWLNEGIPVAEIVYCITTQVSYLATFGALMRRVKREG